MDATLHRLGELLIQAIPTVICFILLTFYLKHVFFKPLAKILDERKRATEGVRELAQRAFEAAEKKNAEFEHALHLARAQLHQEHEALRRQWTEEQAALVAQARAEADRQIAEAKQQVAREVELARAELEARADSLSQKIVDVLLQRRAA